MAAAGVPIAGEPATDTTPEVAGCVVGAQPGLDPFETEASDCQCVIDVEGGGDVGVGPGAGVSGRDIGSLHLKDSDAFTAVEPKLRVVLAVAIALKVLSPRRLRVGLGTHVVLIEAPLAGTPPKDLIGGAGEVSVDSSLDGRVPLADV